jgi:hypothetical protein
MIIIRGFSNANHLAWKVGKRSPLAGNFFSLAIAHPVERTGYQNPKVQVSRQGERLFPLDSIAVRLVNNITLGVNPTNFLQFRRIFLAFELLLDLPSHARCFGKIFVNFS